MLPNSTACENKDALNSCQLIQKEKEMVVSLAAFRRQNSMVGQVGLGQPWGAVGCGSDHSGQQAA